MAIFYQFASFSGDMRVIFSASAYRIEAAQPRLSHGVRSKDVLAPHPVQ